MIFQGYLTRAKLGHSNHRVSAEPHSASPWVVGVARRLVTVPTGRRYYQSTPQLGVGESTGGLYE